MRLLALPQDWRYGVLELGQQICREEMPEKRRLRALENVRNLFVRCSGSKCMAYKNGGCLRLGTGTEKKAR